MNTHEYQAKNVLKKYGVPIPDFWIETNRQEGKAIIENLNLKKAVIKIQVHAGGRGKAGGVKFAKSSDEMIRISTQLIGMKMVNHQTGPEGVVAHHLMISRPIDIKNSFT